MDESFEEYQERVLSCLGSRDPMRVLSTTGSRLQKLTARVPAGVLRKRPAVGKWSVAEILAHMADAELAIGWRFRNMVATPGVRLQWWDEHLWSEALTYSRIPGAASLKLFEALRSSNLALLRSISRSQWDGCYGVHDKRGRQSVAEFVRMEAAHDLNHLEQVVRILDREPRRRLTRRRS